MNPLHGTSNADYDIFLKEICFRKIAQFPASKNRRNPLHTIKFIPDSDMLFPYSYQNSIP